MYAGFSAEHRAGSGSPMVCLHGFTDSWRTWELVLPRLEHHHDVFAPTLAGHAGGPPIANPITDETIADAVEQAMDRAGIGSAHIVGNSLGGHIALQLASRGRAESVVALAPAGGWADGDLSYQATLEHFVTAQELVKPAADHADEIAATPAGRRAATQFITANYEHIPPDLIAYQIRAAAACDGAGPLIEYALREGWNVDLGKVECPVRLIWGSADRILTWPAAAAGFGARMPHAEWVVLDGVGHCPQLDVPLEAAELILEFARG